MFKKLKKFEELKNKFKLRYVGESRKLAPLIEDYNERIDFFVVAYSVGQFKIGGTPWGKVYREVLPIYKQLKSIIRISSELDKKWYTANQLTILQKLDDVTLLCNKLLYRKTTINEKGSKRFFKKTSWGTPNKTKPISPKRSTVILSQKLTGKLQASVTKIVNEKFGSQKNYLAVLEKAYEDPSLNSAEKESLKTVIAFKRKQIKQRSESNVDNREQELIEKFSINL